MGDDRLTPRVEIEELAARFEQNLTTWFESFGELLEVGDRDSLEILLEEEGQSVAEIWDTLLEPERQRILGIAGQHLGVDLLDIKPEQIARHYYLDGVAGERTEGGAQVDVLGTGVPGLEVHVLCYQNPEVGTRYDLVRCA